MTLSSTCADRQASFIPSHFTGKERDSESGNDYFGARYYASVTGRWLSPDPSGIGSANLADPQSLNLYSYVGNEPLSRIDLMGLCWKGRVAQVSKSQPNHEIWVPHVSILRRGK
jgi:RHS repeat-associated protein